jgi:hypothetical protein
MKDKFLELWKKIPEPWRYAVIMGTIISAIWAVNVYSHWQPNVVQNKDIGMKLNHMAKRRFDTILKYAIRMHGRDENARRDLAIIIQYAQGYPRIYPPGEWANHLPAADSVPTFSMVENLKRPVDRPAPKNIIDSIYTENISKTEMVVRVLSKVKNRAHAEFGTEPGKWTGEGLRERSLNYNNHHLRIGNNPKYPLTPGTKYYIRVVSEDAAGHKFYSKTITATTAK